MKNQGKRDHDRGFGHLPWFLLLALLGVLGLAVVINVMNAMSIRIAYPLDLEWMEGAILLHTQRVIDGKSLYTEPSVEHIAFAYTPLYMIVLGGLSAITGLSLKLGRLLSLFSLLGIFIIMGLSLFRSLNPRRKLLPLLLTCSLTAMAAGLFLGDFLFTGAWLDIVRNDTLYLFLVFLGLYLLVENGDTLSGSLFSGLFLALAFWTKQTAVVFILAAGLYQLFSSPRMLPWLVLSVATITL
ncbi:glycosyltransferase family 39 protein, partial [Myxococcota bacterium]|nr:glycosyltransferase family 39 protein [Myxococcota bacterium]MBU1534738.1 glycosyltransferase family 39 protein [Myxococcota bacterium]